MPISCDRAETIGGEPGAVSLFVFSGDLDKLTAAFSIATGAAAMGLPVTMFFAFWGMTAVRERRTFRGKNLVQRAMTAVLPSGPSAAGPSRFAWLGLGRVLFRLQARRNHAPELGQLVAQAREMNIRMVVCESSMAVMGIEKQELVAGLEFGGVVTYVAASLDSRMTLFI